MINLHKINTPIYILQRKKLQQNLKILKRVQENTGAKILLALKGFAFHRAFDLVRENLAGTCASGLFEARLGAEKIGMAQQKKDVCVFSPAFKSSEISALLPIATHIIFNSFSQFHEHYEKILAQNSKNRLKNLPEISIGMRVNPMHSTVKTPLYDPCAPKSRFGVTPEIFHKKFADLGSQAISGLHFHAHCEQNSDALKESVAAFSRHFGKYFPHLRWVNFGGGHHITRADYDVKGLEQILKDFKNSYNLQVFLEPGEAVGWQCGFFLTSVVDVVENAAKIAILDASATAHMPDCLEMPYRPCALLVKKSGEIFADLRGENDFVQDFAREKADFVKNFAKSAPDPKNLRENPVILGGCSCLSGDVIGEYDFGATVEIGDRVAFLDMMHYTIVKNTAFNGICPPSFGEISEGKFTRLKDFDYDDYFNRN